MARGRVPHRARAAAPERLVAALAQPGCPVCRCVEEDARRDLAAFLREQVMDPAGRADLRAAGGFCAWHTGLLRDAADGILSVAILAEDLLGGGPPQPGGCSACTVLRVAVDGYLGALLTQREAPPLRQALDVGPGLPCRPHLRRLRVTAAEPAALAALEDTIAARVARLRAALGRFIAKQDYRNTEPASEEEARAWQEALEHLAGRPALFGSDLARP